ncbi:flagellar biosynthesis protein FlhB [Phenylobacterium sp.]|uniref:flagellar biosynthesis protein FlhB n=1 Tax=Phenylobacterium sp. TaxID=1871053 RepID=UPI0025DFB29B|nr:flagellar biosynthesis protein FlhB [Phenylobacterium sp.]
MSEAPDRESQTEDATPRKLEQAREKGDGVKTMDLGSFATLAASAAVVLMAGGGLARNLAAQLLPFFAHPHAMPLDGHSSVEVFRYALMAALPPLVIVMMTTGASGAAASLLQGGLRLTPEKLKPDFSKVSIPKGFGRIYGPDGLAQFVKSLVKVGMTGAIAWWLLKPYLPQFASLSALDPAAIIPFSFEILKRLVFAVAALTLTVAAADWLWQRQRFMARMRMTREEVKQDFKNSEGDPHIRARQKQIRADRARRRMMQAVPDATVVVMNPTHYAVALKYEQGADAAPTCVAKGLDNVALRIRAVAEAAGVPIIEDPALARALYAAVDIDDMIPPAHYEAVAKIIGFILGAAAGRRATARA